MWLVTKGSPFISVVVHKDNPDVLQVRARRRRDLDDMALVSINEPWSNGGTDYPWRVDVDRRVFAEYVADQVMQMDYTSHVKDVIAEHDPTLRDCLYGVWRTMIGLERDENPDDAEPLVPVESDYESWADDWGDPAPVVGITDFFDQPKPRRRHNRRRSR